MYLIYPDLSNSDLAKINSFVDSTLRDITLDRITINVENCELSIGEKLTILSLSLMSAIDHDYMFFKNQQLELALVIFSPNNLEHINTELLQSVTTDSIYFNTIDFVSDRHWMLGSVQSVLKVLKSADKLLNLNTVRNETLDKVDRAGSSYQLAWFAHRVGLKVYGI
jgi:hypothetical protein